MKNSDDYRIVIDNHGTSPCLLSVSLVVKNVWTRKGKRSSKTRLDEYRAVISPPWLAYHDPRKSPRHVSHRQPKVRTQPVPTSCRRSSYATSGSSSSSVGTKPPTRPCSRSFHGRSEAIISRGSRLSLQCCRGSPPSHPPPQPTQQHPNKSGGNKTDDNHNKNKHREATAKFLTFIHSESGQ